MQWYPSTTISLLAFRSQKGRWEEKKNSWCEEQINLNDTPKDYSAIKVWVQSPTKVLIVRYEDLLCRNINRLSGKVISLKYLRLLLWEISPLTQSIHTDSFLKNDIYMYYNQWWTVTKYFYFVILLSNICILSEYFIFILGNYILKHNIVHFTPITRYLELEKSPAQEQCPNRDRADSFQWTCWINLHVALNDLFMKWTDLTATVFEWTTDLMIRSKWVKNREISPELECAQDGWHRK